jgi:hypothetical protein
MTTQPAQPTHPNWPASWPHYQQDRTAADRAVRAVDALPPADAYVILRTVARAVAAAPPTDQGRIDAFHQIESAILGPRGA